MSSSPHFEQRAVQALETIALELTAIREGLTKTNEWLDSINANQGEMVGHLEAFTEVEPGRTILDSELPEPKEGDGDNTTPG